MVGRFGSCPHISHLGRLAASYSFRSGARWRCIVCREGRPTRDSRCDKAPRVEKAMAAPQNLDPFDAAGDPSGLLPGERLSASEPGPRGNAAPRPAAGDIMTGDITP